MAMPLARRVLIAVVAALLLWVLLGSVGSLLLKLEAASVSSVLSLLGVDNIRLGNTVYVEMDDRAIGFRVEWHCSGLATYTILLVFVLLVPLGLRRKLYWLLLGFLVVYLVNILRMVAIIAVAELVGAEKAMEVHGVVAPLLLVGVLMAFGIVVLHDALQHTHAMRG